jgi:hypothetical protein
MPKATMLTTFDNRFDPFDDWDNWYRFDHDKGYCTCEYIARVSSTSSELSEADEELAILTAIYEIASLEPEKYKVITKEVEN